MLTRSADTLQIEGLDAASLAQQHGTPVFVYSADQIRRNVQSLRASLDAVHRNVTIAFAAKACPLQAILRLIATSGCDLEVNSDGELARATRAGVYGSRIVANGVARSETELRALIDGGLRAINVDSLSELDRIISLAGHRRPRLALRVIPGLDARTTPGIDTASEQTKFGMTLDEIETAIVRCEQADVDLVGLHVHVGSQVTDPNVYSAAGDFVVPLLDRFEHDWEFVNVGGGFPVDYSRGRDDLESYLSSEQITEHLAGLLSPIGEARPELAVIVEPGRLLVANAAVLLTRVQSEKPRPDRHWLYLDAGYHTLLEAFTYRWYFHLVHATRSGREAEFNVVGPLCDSGDSFSDVDGEGLTDRLVASGIAVGDHLVRLPSTRSLPDDTAVGDLLAFLDCGAYTQDQIFGINGRGRPAVVLVDDGTPRVIRSADTVEQLWLNEHD